jgi:hypothetical protein
MERALDLFGGPYPPPLMLQMAARAPGPRQGERARQRGQSLKAGTRMTETTPDRRHDPSALDGPGSRPGSAPARPDANATPGRPTRPRTPGGT